MVPNAIGASIAIAVNSPRADPMSVVGGMGLDNMVERTVAICDALAERFDDRIVTVHGGSIEAPDNFAALLHSVPRLDAYIGGSSAERFPIEDAVPKAAEAFKSVRRS